jgi:hypothetical protein
MNLQVKKASKKMVKKASKQQGEESIKTEMMMKNANEGCAVCSPCFFYRDGELVLEVRVLLIN